MKSPHSPTDHTSVAAYWGFTFASILTASIYFLSSDIANATELGTILCNFVDIANSKVGGAFATLGIIIVGASACLGKASWGMAVTVIIGIAVLFGAKDLISLAGATGC